MNIKTLLFLSTTFTSLALGQVTPPNYDFSLDSLTFFYPGSTREEIQKKYGKGEQYSSEGGKQVYRFYVFHARYRFPVFVQFQNNRSIAFWAALPSYFLHDVFHQDLIKKYGKQDRYFKKENSALFIWNKVGNTKLIYSGQCALTCFPVYLAGIKTGGQIKNEGLLKKVNRQQPLVPLSPLKSR